MEKDDYVAENEIQEEEQEEGYYPAPADMKHWGSLSYWTLDECVALPLELDPESLGEKLKFIKDGLVR